MCKQERELLALNESLRKTQEATISSLEADIAEKRARMTQELSEANMRAADSLKFAEETCKRADAAEAIQATMQVGDTSTLSYLVLSYLILSYHKETCYSSSLVVGV